MKSQLDTSKCFNPEKSEVSFNSLINQMTKMTRHGLQIYPFTIAHIESIAELFHVNRVFSLDITGGCFENDAFVALITTLETFHTLNSLKITDSGISNYQMIKLAGTLEKHHPELHKLDISDNRIDDFYTITDSAAKSLAKITSLTDLNISNTNIQSTGLVELLTMPHLTNLDARHLKINDGVAKIIAAKSCLQTINIDTSNLSAEGVAIFNQTDPVKRFNYGIEIRQLYGDQYADKIVEKKIPSLKRISMFHSRKQDQDELNNLPEDIKDDMNKPKP